MLCNHDERIPVESYGSYKKKKFEKTLTRIENILKGIDQLSLEKSDKEKLLKKIKNKVESFEGNYSGRF